MERDRILQNYVDTSIIAIKRSGTLTFDDKSKCLHSGDDINSPNCQFIINNTFGAGATGYDGPEFLEIS
jgi:hypothetical protein